MLVLKNIVCVAAVFAVVCLLGVATCSATPIEVIQNGSFENGKAIPTGYVGCALGTGSPTSDISYWTLTRPGSTIFAWYMTSTYSANHDGDRGVDITANAAGQPEYMSQSFGVTAGYTYTLSYWSKYRNTGGKIASDLLLSSGIFSSVTDSINVTVSGQGTGDLTTSNAGTSGWTNYGYTFIPSANATATLTFSNPSTTPSPNGEQFLDHVSVLETAVPEPGTLALLAAGLAGLLCYAWRKQR
jgi:hypothetical protein